MIELFWTLAGALIMAALIWRTLRKNGYTPSTAAQQAQRDVAKLVKDANERSKP